ncbi:glycine-rich domain-containing protein [Lacrimispora defluvii]|uniref:Glycine-rich domain-containing protein n=1 Tax=Lacrimispora defluvii TaxID=2719233 RepID=A0ABX1VW28_9FIRM|nr:hypothetical protein [Lacrimispora defluvii]NNJ32635.1 hypothetical protein [Lacrimispora defluvii]
MGKMIISETGGAGAGSEECTATRAELLKGYTAITNDSDDEMVEGTLELTGDAADSQVLAGKSYYNTNPKNKRAGSMVNQGAVNQTLNAGGSYTIPAGYHNGSGKVIANSLASQTGGTASAGHILSGQTAWVNGSKITGTLTIQSVASFSLAQYATQQIIASWALPSVGPWSGIRVMCKQGSYPAHAGDGTLFYEGAGTWASKQLAEGIWYFRSWNYITTNFGRNYGGYVQGSINNTAITGTQTFTSSGIFTVPAKVYAVNVFLVGGGAAGGYGDRSGNFEAGSGGGGGYTATHWNIPVTPGQTISVSIGAGGSLNTNGYPNNGGNTTFGSYSVAGGTTYRNGGSGGGRGTYRKAGYPGGDGGSDGGNGGRADSNYGLGQHTTTRAFGEPNGTLYAGGGGGGGNGSEGVSYRGVGGSGGGGNGRDGWNAGSAGAANTGGGGGGGWCGWSDENGIRGSSGGSGICIVRWGY